jgi:DHA1 family multidrug resistance protein-like MFS transporter
MSLLSSLRDSFARDRQAWPLLAMICVSMTGSGMMVPVLSLYAATFGVTSTLVGMLMTIFGIGRLVSNYPGGWLSQRLGRRPLLIAGSVVIGVGCIGAALTNDFYHLVFWRFVQGVGSGMYMTVSGAALADMTTSESRARIVGLYQAALQFGASIGPVFGGFVASYFGLRAPFWALLAISVATVLLGIFSFRDQHAKVSTMSGALGVQRGLITLPFISIALVSCVVFFTRTAFLFQLVPLIGDAYFKLGVAAIGFGITITAGVMLLVLPLATALINRLGSRMSVFLSLLVSALGIALVIGGAHPFWFWISMIVYGLAGGFNGSAVAAYTIEVLPRNQYGQGMGLQRTIGDIGYVAGPVVIGLVSDWSSFGNAAGVAACSALILIAAFLFLPASYISKSRSR